MLLRTFPKYRDYSGMLDDMMQRKKLPSESMTKYYQDKAALCFRCKISDSASVSCIIRGLPQTLQASARASQCKRPDELYENFLCAIDDYRAPFQDARLPSKESNRPPTDKKTVPINLETDPCPRCKKTGHILRNCSLPDLRTCFKCGKQGHIATKCSTAIATKTAGGNDVKEIKVLQCYNDIYRKVVKVNDIHVKAYLDTGSEVNVLTTEVSQLLELAVTPTSVALKGFSGGFITSRGEVSFQLEIDGIAMNCSAHLTDIDMKGINLLIGQPVINGDGITLIVNKGTATLMEDSSSLSRMEVTEENHRFKVVTAHEECLPPGASIVKIYVLGNRKDNDVVTTPRHFELGGVTFSLPATVLRGIEGYIKVVNTGNETVAWQQGEVLVRAETCEELHCESQVRANAISKLSIKSILCANLATECIGGVEIKTGPLCETEHSSLMKLLTHFKRCFASSTHDLGCTSLVQMKINLTTDKPIHRQPYRLSHSEQEIVKTKVNELLDAGIVKESESEYASPVILEKKKNGDSRLCVDYRALNAVTVKDRHPLPNIDDQVSKLAGKKYFTSLDMAQSYHQVPIAPNDTHKTAFVTPRGHYEYTRVPFGLANAPSVFMRMINKLVESMEGNRDTKSPNEILAFLDDLLLPSRDVESGLQLLETVLQKLETENLKLNIDKCSFLQNRVTYLGHEISSEGIQPGQTKLNAVSQFPVPSNVSEIRQFIGLCSYFRKFIFNFARIARPLTDLTKKNATWVWGSEQEESFMQLKTSLCTKPVLALFDPALPTEIHTDACKLGIAGILLQKQSDDTLRPVMYFSRVTSKEESMYHSYELETLAVVESLRRFRIYVVGKHIKVVTDCTAVRATLTKRDIIPRIARWWLSIQDYDMSIEYRPGERMAHVDALSRNPLDTVNINRLEV